MRSRMEQLMNRYSLDGRDPVSYASFGLGARAATIVRGPNAPCSVRVRYMTSDSTRRKLKMKQFLQKYGGRGPSDARLF